MLKLQHAPLNTYPSNHYTNLVGRYRHIGCLGIDLAINRPMESGRTQTTHLVYRPGHLKYSRHPADYLHFVLPEENNSNQLNHIWRQFMVCKKIAASYP